MKRIPRLSNYEEWKDFFKHETVRFVGVEEDGSFALLPSDFTVYCYRSSLLGVPIERNLIAVAYRSYEKLVDLYPPDFVAQTLNFMHELLITSIPSGMYIRSFNPNLIVVCNYTPLFAPGAVCYDYESVRDNSQFLGFTGVEARCYFIADLAKQIMLDDDSTREMIMRCVYYDPGCLNEDWSEIDIPLIPPILFFQIGSQ